MTLTIISALLLSIFMTENFVKANPNVVIFPDSPNMTLPILTVQTPTQNGSYPIGEAILDFNVTKPDNSWFWGGYGIPPSSAIASVSYYIDGKYVLVYNSNRIDDRLPEKNQYTIKLENLTGGKHEVGIEVHAWHFYGGLTTTPQKEQNSKSIQIAFYVDANPPKISNLSIENKTYTSPNLEFNFTVDNQPSWTGYSLDNQENSTVSVKAVLTGFNSTIKGKSMLTDLSEGIHSIVVYSNNSAGTMCESDTIIFTVNTPTPTPSPTPTMEPTTEPTPTPTPPPSQNPSLSSNSSPAPTQEPTTEPTQTALPTAKPNSEPDNNSLSILVGVTALIAITVLALTIYFKKGYKEN
ncbi:MAG: hypothetical protein NWF05_05785 [Candidatus Bathyarchaeota archaeon]|nr:hypothetical protein [Candidatus Bathyarchaeota archaeon]